MKSIPIEIENYAGEKHQIRNDNKKTRWREKVYNLLKYTYKVLLFSLLGEN